MKIYETDLKQVKSFVLLVLFDLIIKITFKSVTFTQVLVINTIFSLSDFVAWAMLGKVKDVIKKLKH